MDCSTALDILNGSVPASEEEWEAAALHLEACPECDEIFRRETDFDRQVTATMQAVAIPPGLKSSLLTALELAPAETSPQTDSPPASPAVTPAPRPRFLRDRWLPLTLAGSACVVAALAFLLFQQPEPPRFSLAELSETGAKLDWGQLPDFDGQVFSLDTNSAENDTVNNNLSLWQWKQTAELNFSPTARGWKPQGGGGLLSLRPEPHLMAVYQFEVPLSRGPSPSARGLLLAVPIDRLKTGGDAEPLPIQDHFTITNVRYTGDNRFARVAWVEGNLVFICLVERPADAGDTLDVLFNILYGPPV